MKNGPEIFKGYRRKKGARIVLLNHLHNESGQIRDFMRMILDDAHWNKNAVEIVIYWKDDQAVACVYRMMNVLMAYCLPRHRRKGYATACVDALKMTGEAIAYRTIYSDFWKSQKIKIKLRD